MEPLLEPERKIHLRRREALEQKLKRLQERVQQQPPARQAKLSPEIMAARQSTTNQFLFGATPDSTIIIGVWGSRQRKIKASYQLFLYTLLGSVFMLLAILLILVQTGTTDLQISLTTEFSEQRQIFLWIASFASFAVKVPMSNALGSSHGGKRQNVVVRRLDAFPSLPGIVPHRKKERRAPARPRECTAQMNLSFYIESPAGHRGPSGKDMIRKGFFHWGQISPYLYPSHSSSGTATTPQNGSRVEPFILA
ncbi:NADH:ubiquinone dehydrogenase subunit 4 [Datura stramonium]|uniref:NADH-ubiquinone oxidoreductase chain 4 n=1 Tax=Datura stramonium TaxID=4076 RepID=A0ABS8RPD3_DATST|nr:NADH:ubiquinone dehydrogenase subunit 4 [Datura stramonium]